MTQSGHTQAPNLSGKQDACKTFLDQTKQLITLASAFLFAPAATFTFFKDANSVGIGSLLGWFIAAEFFLVASVIAGYVTIGAIAGTQNSGEYDVFRPALRKWALVQFGSYVIGVILFAVLLVELFCAN